MDQSKRHSHANADRAVRERKAKKILRVISSACSVSQVQAILEVGCGSGYIAAWLAKELPGVRVVGVDITDERQDRSFEFHLFDGTDVPLADSGFDIVISNHVIEHVGGSEDQLTHLREIRRLLKPHGIAYLATPWRYAILEPHYRLPLLGWFPPPINDFYVRATRRGTWYDVTPTTRRQLANMLSQVRATGVDMTLPALVATLQVEGPLWLSRILAAVPLRLSERLVRFAPSIIWLVSRSPGDASRRGGLRGCRLRRRAR